jgi:hypothetical protein
MLIIVVPPIAIIVVVVMHLVSQNSVLTRREDKNTQARPSSLVDAAAGIQGACVPVD